MPSLLLSIRQVALWGIALVTMMMVGPVGLKAQTLNLASVMPVMACERLSGAAMRGGEDPMRITAARSVGGGTPSAYCMIQGYVAPQVKFEIHLPLSAWQQRLLYTGCGGFCGGISLAPLPASDGCVPLNQGNFATVASNLGHDGGMSDALWAANNPSGLADFGHRGVHVVTLAAKAIIARFYGQPPRYAYFVGCSDGGREAMMEAQRHPGDFNGIIAGAPVINEVTNNSVYHAWIAQHLLSRSGAQVFTYPALAILHNAVLQACDGLDGQSDGIIAAASGCHFSPRSLACGYGAPQGACLSEQQVRVAEALYDGPRDTTGRALYFGFPFGSEYNWIEQAYSSTAFATSFISYMSAKGHGEEVNVQALDFSPSSVRAYRSAASVLNAVDPDLSAFAAAGGKLIMWHGETDVGVPPGSTLDYVRKVRARLGRGAAERMLRLYMVPGVNHCGGGNGPDGFDLLTPLMQWVENGIAPTQITAANRKKTTQPWMLIPFADDAKVSAFPLNAIKNGLTATSKSDQGDAR